MSHADFVKCPSCGLNHRVRADRTCPKCGASDDAGFQPSQFQAQLYASPAPATSFSFGLLGWLGVPAAGFAAFRAAVWLLSGGMNAQEHLCVDTCESAYESCIMDVDLTCHVVAQQVQCMVKDSERAAIQAGLEACSSSAAGCAARCH
jgi:hypothetical protein